jgi:hypothetical protein
MSLKDLFNNGTSGGGPGGGLPVGNKPTKGNNSGITLGIPTKTDPLAGQKAAKPGYGFGPNKVNVAQNSIYSKGTKPGSQVTTNVPSKQKTTNIGTKKYSGKKSYVDVLGESGNFSNQSFDQMMVGAEGKPHFEDTPENREKWKQYYKPVTETKGTPGGNAIVSAPIDLPDNPAEKTTSGETTVETETVPDDKTTKDNKLGNLPIGSANVTKGGTGRKSSNPINPVSLATSASQSKDFNLKLNNQAVNKA